MKKYRKIFNKEFFHYFSLLGYLGFFFLLNILIFLGMYKLIEKYLFKSDLLFIIFLLVGIISGFYNAYKLIFKKK
jgi:F0F1-type ATP synthase assembly protein I